MVGGENADNTVTADTQIYNPATNAWSTGVSYPTGIASASAAVVKNVLYVFGGTGDLETPSNAVWAYSCLLYTSIPLCFVEHPHVWPAPRPTLLPLGLGV